MRRISACAALAVLCFGCGASEQQADGGLINGKNVNLASIKVSDGTLSPSFRQFVTGYNVDLPESAEFITVKPKAADSSSLITVNGLRVDSGSPSDKISLTQGRTVLVSISVRSPDGNAEKKYSVAVYRSGKR